MKRKPDIGMLAALAAVAGASLPPRKRYTIVADELANATANDFTVDDNVLSMRSKPVEPPSKYLRQVLEEAKWKREHRAMLRRRQIFYSKEGQS